MMFIKNIVNSKTSIAIRNSIGISLSSLQYDNIDPRNGGMHGNLERTKNTNIGIQTALQATRGIINDSNLSGMVRLYLSPTQF